MNKLLFHCEIPVDKHISKKNQKTIRYNPKSGRRYIGTRKETAQELKNMQFHISVALNNTIGLDFPLAQPLHAKFLFYYPDILVRRRKTLPDLTKKPGNLIDLSNLIQGVEDSLQSEGVIKDDKLIESYDGTRRIYHADELKIEVFIYDFIE